MMVLFGPALLIPRSHQEREPGLIFSEIMKPRGTCSAYSEPRSFRAFLVVFSNFRVTLETPSVSAIYNYYPI
jgi:hypothetical protein